MVILKYVHTQSDRFILGEKFALVPTRRADSWILLNAFMLVPSMLGDEMEVEEAEYITERYMKGM